VQTSNPKGEEMRNFKNFGVLVAAAAALGAIGAANASGAQFTAEPGAGSIAGKAILTQVITISGGKIECSVASASGAIPTTAATQLHVTVHYTGCTAFGFATVDMANGTYVLTASGSMHIKEALTVTPTLFGSSICTVTFTPQTVSTTDFGNSGASNMLMTPTITGLDYHSTGGACGPAGTNGTYTGASEYNRVGGGTLRFDA
jgi:hypothetical protein